MSGIRARESTSDPIFSVESQMNGKSTQVEMTYQNGTRHDDAVRQSRTEGTVSVLEIQDENGDEMSRDAPSSSSLSKRSKLIAALCAFGVFLATCSFSIIGPFFPLEADKKGLSIVLTGLVFSSFEIMMFLTSPIFGIFLTKLGPKNVYLTGIVVGGISSMAFGLLSYVPSGAPYAVASVGIRSIGSIGFSAFNTASFPIVSQAFKENIGLAFAFLQAGSGIGYMAGPALGGALYELGGFGLPFYVVGFLVLLNGFLVFKFIPPIHKVDEPRKQSALCLFRSPIVVVSMCTVFVGMLGIITVDATLARHVESLGLNPGTIGLFFMIIAAGHTLMSPVYGYLTDKRNIQAPLMIGGNFMLAVGFFILGPSMLFPFVPFRLWTVGLGLAMQGMFLGCCLIPTMKCMVVGAIEVGLEDSMDTHALVSGFFNTVTCLGGLLGPLAFGALIEEFGYSLSYTVIGVINIFVMLLSLVYFSIRDLKRRKSIDLSKQ